MRLKDKLIRKLLDTGKKHRLLVYPTLALVAIITAVSHAVYWGRGNGKKLVASIMVMVMLITQSIFLTSSANVDEMTMYDSFESTHTAGDAIPMDDTATPLDNSVTFWRVDNSGDSTYISTQSVKQSDDGEYYVDIPTKEQLLSWCFNDDATLQTDCVNFSEMYLDAECNTVMGSGIIDENWEAFNGTYNIYFIATRVKYPVVISDGIEDSNTVAMETIYDYVDVAALDQVPGDIYPKLNYTIKTAAEYGSLFRYGYDFNGVKYIESANSNGIAFGIGKTVSLDPSTELPVSKLNLKTQWQAMKFMVSFDAKGTGAPSSIKVDEGQDQIQSFEYTYNSEQFIPSDETVWAGNEAYILTGWDEIDVSAGGAEGVKVNTNALATEGTVTDSPNIIGRTLNAIWTYKDIQILATKNGVVSEDGYSVKVEATYGDYIETEISAIYRKDQTAGTQFTYALSDEDEALLNQYGLTFLDNGSSYTISGTLNNITDETMYPDGISVTLNITDTNKDSNNTTQHKINIVSNKKELTIDPASIKGLNGKAPSMAYDGTSVIAVNPNISLIGLVGDDVVSATIDGTATLDTPDAGKGKALTITNVTMVGDADDLTKYYIKDITADNKTATIPGIAEVMQMSISVSIRLVEGESSSILFGEETPDYTLTISSKEKLSATDLSLYEAVENSSDTERMRVITQLLGFEGWNCERDIYSSVGSYSIYPKFNSAGKNYTVSTDGVSTSFTVSRDNGVKLTGDNVDTANYKFSSEPGSNGFYPGLVITATGKYDKIRIVGSESDITLGMTKAEAEGKFVDSYIVPDMINGTISFQMLDVNGGAISNIVTLTGVSVDTTPPVMLSYKVSPNVEYFNEFKFGSYYHSQVIDGKLVESISLTFNYQANGSDCSELFYYFVDENGNVVGDKASSVTMKKDNLTGNFTASFTIGTGKYGQLIVYAMDSTGNSSVRNKIMLQDYIEYIEKDQSSDNYYEWMVENTIESAVIEVKSGDNPVSSSDNWYKELQLQVDANDAESGLNKIVWVIEGPTNIESENKEVKYVESAEDESCYLQSTAYGKVLSYSFKQPFVDNGVPGVYYATAILYDNAGNSVELDKVGPYYIDSQKPVIDDSQTVVGDYEYLAKVDWTFTVTEKANESGVSTVKLYKKGVESDELLKSWEVSDSYSYEIGTNGTYYIEAIDKAGNVSILERSFTGLSDVTPIDPTIDIDGTFGNDGWYKEDKPVVTITAFDTTEDGVPVTTYCKITTASKEIEKVITADNNVFSLEEEGNVKIDVWSVSAAGVSSQIVSRELNVDITKPEVKITGSSRNEAGNLVVDFTVSDSVSGVNLNKVLINGDSTQLTTSGGVISGSFEVVGENTYEIYVEDLAGNVADTEKYVPLRITSVPVSDITTKGAYLEADVYEGTYPIEDCYIVYKKATDVSYRTCLINKYDTDYGVNMNCTFRDLDPDTVYDYKILAKSETSKEVRTIEGQFKTKSTDGKGSVIGTVEYGEGATPSYPVYVSLFEGNTFIETVVLEDEKDTDFRFNGIKDGAYNVVATDGVLTKTAAVVLENAGIAYPEDYATNGGIHFVLNSMSTSIEIEDNSINLTADGLEKIYDTSLFEGIITRQDRQVLDEGGSIDITLHAGYIDASSVGATESSMFKEKLGKDVTIHKYIDMYIVKEVKDENGNYVNGTPELVPEIYEPITVSFPLGELAGKDIKVAAVHEANNYYSFFNWDADEEISVTGNYVTITTKYFSIYALYSSNKAPEKFVVKWVDGDGNIIKSETVEKGKAATPPSVVPTKSPSKNYTYKFSGWDTDYSNITKNTIISAKFTANKIEDEPTTEDNDKPTTEDNDKPTTEDNDKPNKEDDDKTTTEDDKKPTTEDKDDYTYMGTGENPQTGDATPVMVLAVVMMMAMAGMVFTRKKIKE